jgi:hypothetical protein
MEMTWFLSSLHNDNHDDWETKESYKFLLPTKHQTDMRNGTLKRYWVVKVLAPNIVED